MIEGLNELPEWWSLEKTYQRVRSYGVKNPKATLEHHIIEKNIRLKAERQKTWVSSRCYQFVHNAVFKGSVNLEYQASELRAFQLARKPYFREAEPNSYIWDGVGHYFVFLDVRPTENIELSQINLRDIYQTELYVDQDRMVIKQCELGEMPDAKSQYSRYLAGHRLLVIEATGVTCSRLDVERIFEYENQSSSRKRAGPRYKITQDRADELLTEVFTASKIMLTKTAAAKILADRLMEMGIEVTDRTARTRTASFVERFKPLKLKVGNN